MYTYSASVRVNPPGAAQQLTRAQLWRGLEIKAANPLDFVPGMQSCKIVEHYPDGFLREIVLRGDRLRERITFTPQILVHFQRVGIPGWITNGISDSDMGLLLTFSFAVEFPGIPPGTEAERAHGERMQANYLRAIETTLATSRRLAAEGAL